MRRSSWILAALASVLLLTPAARASDLDRFVPSTTNFYMQINLKQMSGASMIRKVVPKLLDKYGENAIKMAGQANPQAAMLEGMWPQIQEALRDEEKVNQFFDGFKENVSDVVIAGNVVVAGGADSKPDFIILVGSPVFTQANAQMVAGMVGGQMPGMLKESKLAGKDVWEMTPPGAPQSFFVAIPEDGVLAFSINKDNMEACLKASKEVKFSNDLKPLMANRTDKCSIFLAGFEPKEDERTFAQVMIAKDLEVNVVREFKDGEKAKTKADEMNEEIASAISGAETMLGESGEKLKSLFDALKKNKATVTGNKVTFTTKVATEYVMKMLKD